MSARSVCSGTRPSWYPSVRAISAPPRRPAHLILIPCAPRRIALCTARFMARRNEMRWLSWCTTLSPTSCALSSGRLISSTLSPTSLPVSCASSSRSLSTSAPRLPITTPGRPVCTVTVTFPGLRSMCTSAIAACESRAFRYLRIRSSSFRSSGKSRRAKYRERHGLMIPSRNPYGCVFWPTLPALALLARGAPLGLAGRGLGLLRRLGLRLGRCRFGLGRRGAGGWRLRHGSGPRHADLHVAGALLDRRPPPHRGHREPLQGRALVDDRVVDSQPVLIEALVLPVGRLLGVRHGRREHFPDLHGGVLLGEAQDGVGLRDRPAPNEVHDEAHLPRRLPHVPLHRACFHGLLRDLRRSGFAFLLRRAARVVAAEQARMRELAELVPHHVLRHVDRNELVAVVHGERVPDEVGRNGAAPRPGLEDLLLILVVQGRELLEQRRLHIRALLYRTCHYWVAFPRLRPRTMSLVDAFFLCRVLRPSGLPHGLVGGRPPELLPSPPPSGWSTGFMATPRTRGMRPSQRLFPALPTDSSSCSALPTSPMVARHSPRTMRISVERSRRVTKLPSFATTWALVPAARHSCPPRAILSSTLCTAVPSGISCSGTAFPVRMSAPGPDTTVSPTLRPLGCRM